MAYWVSRSSLFSEPVHGRLIEWEERFPDLKQRSDLAHVFSMGKRELLAQELPSVLTLGLPYRSLPDAFISHGGIMIVSQRVKEIIQSVDGELHQYWPIDVVNQDKSKFDNAQRFCLNVYIAQQSVIDERSDVTNNMFSPENDSLRHVRDRGPKTNLYLDISKLGQLNIWRERRYSTLLMLSDALHTAFREAGVNFFPHFYAHEINGS